MIALVLIPDILKIGDRIELLRINSLKNEIRYPSQLLDIIDDDILVISGPIHKSNLIILHKNDKVRIVCTVKNKGKYVFDAEVLSVEYERVYKLKVKRVSDITRYQQRQFYRLNVSIPVDKYFTIIDENGQKTLKEHCRTKDISGGGMKLFSNYKHNVGDIINCKFEIDGNFFEIKAEVVLVVKVDTFEYDFAIGVKFLDIEEKERDKIIQYIFTTQRKLREKGRM
mgnify:CR=1 FL=1